MEIDLAGNLFFYKATYRYRLVKWKRKKLNYANSIIDLKVSILTLTDLQYNEAMISFNFLAENSQNDKTLHEGGFCKYLN